MIRTPQTMSGAMQVTVVICTHNPRLEYLNKVLAGLRAQTLQAQHWDIVIVDNASQTPVSESLNLDWHPSARCVREETVGLTAARIRGIEESRGQLIVFVDDDNVLDPLFLETAVQLSGQWPCLGVFGGSIEGCFEQLPSARIEPYLRSLALRKVRQPCWSNVPSCTDAEPWGAGMCIRREVAEAYVTYCHANRNSMSDRRGTELTSGGDTEICMVSLEKGWGMGVFPKLLVWHLIPSERLRDDYLVRLAEGLEYSWALISAYFFGKQPANDFCLSGLLRFAWSCARASPLERRMCIARLRGRRRARRTLASSPSTPRMPNVG